MTWAVHTADCLEWLRENPDVRVDAVVTDPPYAERTHAGARSFVPTGRAAMNGFAVGDGSSPLVDFSPLDSDAFVEMCRALVERSGRWVVMTCDWRHAAAAENAQLPVVRCGVWIKPDGAPQFTGDRPSTGWEAVLILHKEGRKRWNGSGGPAVWTCGRDRSELHPSVKPLALVREWIALFTDAGETVLDPFCGSGTTGVACVQTGRNFIGIEIDPTYADIARRRIGEAANTLWTPAPAPAPDPALFGEQA